MLAPIELTCGGRLLCCPPALLSPKRGFKPFLAPSKRAFKQPNRAGSESTAALVTATAAASPALP